MPSTVLVTGAAGFVGRRVQTTQDEMIELLLREVDDSEKVLLVAKD